MSDSTTPQPTLDDVNKIIAQYMPQQSYAPPPPVDRSAASLLGAALGGGTAASGMTPAEEEAAGQRALLNFGLNMLSASGYSHTPRTFGQVFAQGVGGAEQSLGGSEAVSMSRLAAQQAYQEKQQELQLEKLKTAIPLLQMQQQAQSAAEARRQLATPGTSIATAGDGTYEGDVGSLEGTGKSATSTAFGTGQFIEPTWNSFVQANPDLFKGMTPEQILAARANPAIANQAITWLAQQNAPVLAKAGVAPSGTSLALAHRLGPAAAAAVMQAPDTAPVPDVLTASIGKDNAAAYIKANPDLGTATAGDLKRKYAGVHAPGFLGAATAARPPGALAAAPGAVVPPAAPAAPYKVASTGAVPPPPSAAPPAAAPAPTVQEASIRAKATGQPVPTNDPTQPPGTTAMPDGSVKLIPPAPPAPAAPAAPIPAPPASAAPGAQPPAPGAAPPPPLPQYPDVVSGDTVIRHPGAYADYLTREMPPLPTAENFNPNLTPAQQAAFDSRAKGIATRLAGVESQAQGVGTLPFAEQPKAVAELKAQRASLAAEQDNLNAEQQNVAQAKAQAAGEAATKFREEQGKAIQTRYDAEVEAYKTARQTKLATSQDLIKSQGTSQITRNKELMDPYETAATQAAQYLPTIALARQILPQLPKNAAPWLADPVNQAKLSALSQFLPEGWKTAVDGSALYTQIMSNIVGTMGGNVQSGQTGGRESAYQQFRAEYPGLSDTAEGRERGLLYAQELFQRRMQVAEELRKYEANAPRDPLTGIPNMAAARSTVENAVPMLQLPPTSYRPDLPANNPKEVANQAAYARYYKNVPVGGRYIGYVRDDSGAQHPEARSKGAPVKMPDGSFVDARP